MAALTTAIWNYASLTATKPQNNAGVNVMEYRSENQLCLTDVGNSRVGYAPHTFLGVSHQNGPHLVRNAYPTKLALSRYKYKNAARKTINV